MHPRIQLHKDSSNSLFNPTTYRRLIWRLLCLTHSKPQISYVVSILSQFLSAPTDEHMLADLHVLKYLKVRPCNGFFFSSSSTPKLKGFSNSDWGACLDIRRSTADFCLFLGTFLISWKNNKHLWFLDHQQRLSLEHQLKPHVRDNGSYTCYNIFTSIIFLLLRFTVAASQLFIQLQIWFFLRELSIINCHMVRDKVQERFLHFLSIASKDQVGDIMTKSLHVEPFNNLKESQE